VDNPVSLTQYHSGRFTGKGWSCCKAATFRSSPGCKPSTIYGKQWFYFPRKFNSVLPRALDALASLTMHESACSRRGSLPLHDLRSRRQALMMRTNYESCCLSEIGKDRCTQYWNKTRRAASGSRASSIYIQISTTTNDNNTVTNNYKLS